MISILHPARRPHPNETINDSCFFGGDAEPADMNIGYPPLGHTGGVTGFTQPTLAFTFRNILR